MSFIINNYPFQSLSNRLGIVMDSAAPPGEVDCINNVKDETGSLRWFMINIALGSLYL